MDYIVVFQKQISTELLSFFTDSLVGFVTIVLFIYSFIRRANTTLIGSWLSNFFGVFFHEVAHAIVGTVLFAKPINFTVIPKKIEDNGKKLYLLGHVDFKNLKWFNSFLTGLAPLLLLFIATYIENNFWFYFDKNLTTYLLYIYLLIVFIINAIPSSQDLKAAFGNIFGIFFGMFIIILLMYLYNNIIPIVNIYKIL